MTYIKYEDRALPDCFPTTENLLTAIVAHN